MVEYMNIYTTIQKYLAILKKFYFSYENVIFYETSFALNVFILNTSLLQ